MHATSAALRQVCEVLPRQAYFSACILIDHSNWKLLLCWLNYPATVVDFLPIGPKGVIRLFFCNTPKNGDGWMLNREIEITNQLGLHARASAKVTRLAG